MTLLQDGDFSLLGGLDTAVSPELLSAGKYSYAENLAIVDGRLQVRPGFTCRVTLPDGKLQGMFVYSSWRTAPALIVVVSGRLYVVPSPYEDFHEVAGARLSETAERVYGQLTVQAVERLPGGALRFVSPRYLLVLQDGVSPPVVYDGQKAWYAGGLRKIPQGTHMAWAGNRLWVAQRERVFASDIANPLSFVEQETNTFGGVSYFLLPGPCTGLVLLPGQTPSIKSPLLAFTATTTTLFRSNILNRDLWTATEDFQSTIFPTLGCVAPRSIVAANGLLWWLSELGVTRLDAAKFSQESGQIQYLDREIARGLSVSGDLSSATAAAVRNWILLTVPYGGELGAHTWLLDLSPLSTLQGSTPPTWVSVWTGIRPVQWATINWQSRTRLFAISKDADGHNRLYEGLGPAGRDNGVDVPWVLETRGYTANIPRKKYFRFAEIRLLNVRGSLTLSVDWAGALRGPWKRLCQGTFTTTDGTVRAGGPLTEIATPKWPTVLFRTPDAAMAPYFQGSAPVEGPRNIEAISEEISDTAFQLRVMGSGPAAFDRIRVFMAPDREPEYGEPVEDLPDGELLVTGQPSDGTPRPVWTASAVGRAQWRNWAAETSASVESYVSEEDAKKRARQIAQQRAEWILRHEAEPVSRQIST